MAMKEIPHNASNLPVTGPGRVRYLLSAILLITITIHYLQRVNISILLADPQFLADLGLTGETAKQGLLMTFFLLLYALTNFITGPLGDRFGPRRIMALGVFISGIAMVVAGFASAFGIMLFARILLGIGNGIHYPAQGVFVRRWFPPWERGRANAINSIGSNLGPILAMPLFVFIANNWGWEACFYTVALLGLLVALPGVWFLTSDLPEKSPFIGAAEKDYLQKNVGGSLPSGHAARIPFRVRVGKVLEIPWLGMYIIAYASFLSIWFGLLTWLPQYFTMARGISFTTMGFVSSLPYILGIIGLLFAGVVSDRIGRRAPFAVVALAGSASLLYWAAVTSQIYPCIILVSLATGVLSLFMGVYWAMVQTLLPINLVGLGVGMISGVGNFIAALTPLIIGGLIQLTGSYLAGILYLVVFGLVGAVCSWVLVREEKKTFQVKTVALN